jgi:hypothetical protein
LLAKRTMTSGCVLGANSDRRCSPGASYSKLTKAVICDKTKFKTPMVRYVPDSENESRAAEAPSVSGLRRSLPSISREVFLRSS